MAVRTRTLTSPIGRNRASSGLTLIELVVVLAVIAALTFLTLPRLNVWSQGGKLRAAARSLAAASKLARSEAVSQMKTAELRLNSDTGLVEVAVESETVWTRRLAPVVKITQVMVRGQDSMEKPVIFFWPDGRVTEAAVYLSNGQASLTLHLEPLTGYVEVLAGQVAYDWTS